MAEAVAEGLREAGCEVDSFNTNDGRFDVTQFPQYDCAAFGSPDYYSYLAGGLKTFPIGPMPRPQRRFALCAT
jgi:hypothetical protein